MSELQAELNRLAGITDYRNYLDAQGAANLWAGISAPNLLDLPGALNYKAGISAPNLLDLQGVLGYLLGRPQAEPGDFTGVDNVLRMLGQANTYWSVPTNPALNIGANMLTPNQSSLETDVTGWGASTNATVAQSAVQALSGTKSLAITSVAAGDFQAATPNDGSLRATAGISYTASAWFRADTTVRNVAVDLFWYNDAAGLISTTLGTSSADTTTGWTVVSVTGTAPALTASIRVILRAVGAAAGAEIQYADRIALFAGAPAFECVAKLRPDRWVAPNTVAQGILSRWDASGGGQFSFYFLIGASGTISVGLGSHDGAAANTTFLASSVAVPFTNGQAGWVKATWRGSDGRAQFFTSAQTTDDPAAVVWTQLGTDQNSTAQFTHLYGGTQPMLLATGSAGGRERIVGQVFYADVKDGIGGNIIASFDATKVAVGGLNTPAVVNSAPYNWVTNPSFETDLTGWAATNSTAARITTDSWAGTACLEQTVTVASNPSIAATPIVGGIYPVTPGVTYSVDCYVKPMTANRSGQIKIAWYNAAGIFMSQQLSGTSTTVGQWTKQATAGVAPAGAVYGIPVVTWTGGQVNDVFRFDAWAFYQGSINYWVPQTQWSATGTDWYWGVSTNVRTNTVRLPGLGGNYISTPDTAALSITGDIDLRILLAMDNWTPGVDRGLLSKYNTTGNQRSYRIYLNGTGNFIALAYSADGITPTLTNGYAINYPNGTFKWVRVTLQASNGQKIFYDSDDGITWTTKATVAGSAASIFDGTAPLEIGSRNDGTAEMWPGLVRYAEVRNGINGSAVAVFDAQRVRVGSTQSPNVVQNMGSSFGNWTINGTGWSWQVS